jgi:hypothetical protein
MEQQVDYKNSIFFDSGPVISLTTTNLLFILKQFHQQFKKTFVITPKVKEELIDKPILTKRYRFEALLIANELRRGNLHLLQDQAIDSTVEKMGRIANSCFHAHGEDIQIVHPAEIEAVCYAVEYNATSVVIDERTMRLLIENPDALHTILQKKLHTKIKRNDNAIKEFQKYTEGLHVLRSVEIGMIAYKSHMLDEYLPLEYEDNNTILLNSFLWGLKLNGCSISQDEIETLSRQTDTYD